MVRLWFWNRNWQRWDVIVPDFGMAAFEWYLLLRELGYCTAIEWNAQPVLISPFAKITYVRDVPLKMQKWEDF